MNIDKFKQDIDELIAQFSQVLLKSIYHHCAGFFVSSTSMFIGVDMVYFLFLVHY